MPLKINITGQTFGRLTVLEEIPRETGARQLCRCLCCCGVECIVMKENLLRGATKSCGCLRREIHSAMRRGEEPPKV